MDLEQIRPAIEEGNRKFGEGFRSVDARAVAELYTDDAILLPPNAGILKGKENVEVFWGGAMQMGVKDVVLSSVELLLMGDFVCEIGEYRLTIQPEGQEAMQDQGKYLVIWKLHIEGNWKLHIDIWNTSAPA
jgi:ketosteroid isomerase-like protein